MIVWFFILALVLPAYGASKAQRVQVEGTVDVIIEDRRDNTSAMHHWLDTPAGKKKLRIPPGINRQGKRLKTGDRLRVQGLDDGQEISVETVEPLTSIAPWGAIGPQSVLVLMVNFNDNTSQPYTQLHARTVLQQVSAFYRENSFNKTWITNLVGTPDTTDVIGWLTLPISSSGCPYYQIASAADTAARNAGVNPSSYKRKVYAFPNIGCSWWGLGNLGGHASWVDGDFLLAVVAHEIGHNFDLDHSHSLCAPGCSLNEYGDNWCAMGNARGHGHFSAPQKEWLGWLDYGGNPPIITITASGQYRVGGYEAQVNEPKALKVFRGLNASGQRLNYYVEHRIGGSFDTLQKTVLIRSANESNIGEMTLWDLDQLSSVTDWTLDIGQTYVDSAAGVSIKLVSSTPTEALIDVVIGGQPLAAPTNLTAIVM